MTATRRPQTSGGSGGKTNDGGRKRRFKVGWVAVAGKRGGPQSRMLPFSFPPFRKWMLESPHP